MSRSGFVAAEYAQKSQGDPGGVLALQVGQKVEDLLFRLTRTGVIAGRVFDGDGDPIPFVVVDALRQSYAEGKRSLSVWRRVETNDLGEFRLFGLSPGHYFVSAVYPRSSRFDDAADDQGPDSDGNSYAKMYYPGTPNSYDAVSLTVMPGQEIPAIDILMRRVRTYHVRGHVREAVTRESGTNADVLLMPRTKGPQWQFMDQQLRVQPDGSFDIPEVLPGSYLLIAFTVNEGRFYTARTNVDVGDADAEGLDLTVASGTDVKGRIVLDGQPVRGENHLGVSADPVDGFGGRRHAQLLQDGSFILKEMGEGTYQVNISGQSEDCYVKEVRYGESSALGEGFTVVRGEPATLQVTVSSLGARIEGTVADEDGLPAAGVRVVLVPRAEHRKDYYVYKTQTTDQRGHFDLRGIAPGWYDLFSWDHAEFGAWQDPDFLKPFEDKGVDVSLQPADQKSASLVVIKIKSENLPEQ